MTFDEWQDAVNHALKAAGKPFVVHQIDPAQLSAAFQSGQSPVIFARSAVAMPPQNLPLVNPPTHPHTGTSAFPKTINTWLCSIAVALFVFAAYQFADATFIMVNVFANQSGNSAAQGASAIVWRSVIMPTYTSAAGLCFSGMALLAFDRIILILDKIASKASSGQP